MSFLWSKKPPFKETTSLNDKTNVSFTEKKTWKIFGTSDQNHGLTPFKICKFFDYSKISSLWSKKHPFEKTTSSNDKTKVSFTEKKAAKIFGTADRNLGLTPFKICRFFDYRKMSFLWFWKPPFDKTTSGNEKSMVSFTEKKTWKIFGTSDQQNGLTSFKICKSFDHNKMSFLWAKKPFLRKQHLQTTKQKSLLQKSRLERYLELLTSIMG